MKLCRPFFGLLLLTAFLCALPLAAQDGLAGAFSRGAKTAQTLHEFSAQIAAADFDNDQIPDGAVLLETGRLNGQRSFRIEVHVTESANSSITFSTAESGLAISALDVNRDGVPDIIVEKAFTHQRLQVYLNDGHGAFREARAEDYPSPDSSAPTWRPRGINYPSASCLLMPRSHETGSLYRVSNVSQNVITRARLLSDVTVARQNTRAPASSRAPPRLFFAL